MVNQKELFEALRAIGVDFFTGVPDSLLNDFCLYMTNNMTSEQHVMAANEGNAIAIAAGHYMATGKLPLVYMQNSGILYNSDNEYSIVSILDGEVIELKKDNILGYVIEVKHDNNLISIYQGLKSVNVKKGDQINQGTLLGKSGEITLDVNLKNALLFELIKDGKYVNPELYYNKRIKEI
jgi:phosphonopyruvate decarboxylase